MLYGRAAEKALVDGLLADARARRSGVLVVRGGPGIGKTALLDYAVWRAAAASGGGQMQVLRSTGIQSEAELPFAGLHLLLRPALDRLTALPQPQQDALGSALGLWRARPYDRFLIGLAVLSLLAELAEERPLLCLVDDAQWLDRASAGALVFAARRLDAEGIAMIFATRDHDALFPVPGLHTLPLAGLEPASAAALLSAHADGLTATVKSRILAEACGNPLGLIELAAACLANPRAAEPLALKLTDRLQQAFEGQVRQLPADTQTMLVVAAAESRGDVGVLLDAAGRLGVPATATGPAEQAKLISIVDRTVTFRHPLVRAAVYHGATVSLRLAAHSALAAALSNPVDADRRAWHLAAAATAPDEAVAAELERTAGEAMARSGYAAAAAAYERAVQLTADATALPRRLASAAEASAEIGEFDRARSLATRAAAQTTDPIVQARLAHVRARADVAQGRLPAAHRLLAEGASKIAGLDPLQAARMLMYGMHVAWFSGNGALVADTAAQLKTVGAPVAGLSPLIELMQCLGRQAAGRPGDGLLPPAELVAQARQSRTEDPYELTMIAMAAFVLGLIPDARDLLAALVAHARAQGKVGWLPLLLAYQAQALLFGGRHQDALASATEALQIANDTSQPQFASELHGIMAYLAAVSGDQDHCRRLADATLAEPATASSPRPWAHWALALLALGRGYPDVALDHLETIARGPARYHASALRSIPDLVEAAVRIGEPDRATHPLTRFCDWARRASTPSIDALVARCHALLDVDNDPERHYQTALKMQNEPFEQARTQLLYGAWLRRSRRKTEARTQLRAAVDYFDRIGAQPWAEQGRAELKAIGTKTPRPDRAGPPGLTPQELQVARLAAQGLSNRDIAAQLFLSPRTVGYHLYKTYPKLGISSRNELDPRALEP